MLRMIPNPLRGMPRDTLEATVRGFLWLDALWLAGIGAAVIVGGEARMSSPSYSMFRDTFDALGVSILWMGVPPLLAAGVLAYGLLRDSYLSRVSAYFAGAVVAFGLLAGFAAAVPSSPSAGLTAVPTYALVALQHSVLIAGAVEVRVRRQMTQE